MRYFERQLPRCAIGGAIHPASLPRIAVAKPERIIGVIAAPVAFREIPDAQV
jgi:hypothetical protein